MGKSKKLKSSAGDLVVKSTLPLDLQIERSKQESGREVARVKQRKLKRAKRDEEEEFIDAALSNKILRAAYKQKQNVEAVEGETTEDAMQMNARERIRKVSLGVDSLNYVSDEDVSDISDNNDYDESVLQISPEDEAAVEKFVAKSDTPSQTLYVVEMYREIGIVLSHYRSGKIPKAFKVLPKMVNWEQLLYLTNPDKWSAAAMYQATRIFASNLHARMCQRFYNLVLLPRLRDDIAEYKKLNFHLFQALHKSIYKPQAFFKGILLPLCESGTCTLREATIFGSVLAKASIPMMHAAVAMLKIANMEYTGSTSLFLRILIDKKYTLPYRVIDALVKHFLRFRKEERQLPVLWHQTLLAFAQRYKSEISEEQRIALLELIKVQDHYQISPEVSHELLSVKTEKNEIPMEC
uniref:Bystin n=1 Tax=Setaria digitata TaxID=48799 RepID=A0A915PMV6_9BILA